MKTLGLVLFLALAACTPRPPDVPACEHLDQKLFTDEQGHLQLQPSPTCMANINEPSCGHCVWIVSGKEQFVGDQKGHWLGGETWTQVRAHSVYLPSVMSYAPLAAYIIDSCKKMNCSNDVDAFKVKLDSLNGITDAIGNLSQ